MSKYKKINSSQESRKNFNKKMKVVAAGTIFSLLFSMFPVHSLANNVNDAVESVYLTDDCFRHQKSGALSPVSSWDFDKSGGKFLYTESEGVYFNDTSTLAPLSMSKKLRRITSGIITMDTAFVLVQKKEGFTAELKDGEDVICEIKSSNKNLYLYTNTNQKIDLGAYDKNDRIGINLSIDLDNKNLQVIVNGSPKNRANINANGIDTVKFSTTKAATMKAYLQHVKMYTNYGINEKFLSTGIEESFPQYMTKTGNAKIVKTDNSVIPDIYSLLIENGASVSTPITPLTSENISYGFSFLPSENGSAEFKFKDNESNVYSFTYNNNVINLNGEKLYDCDFNVWQKITVREIDNQAQIWINGKHIKNINSDKKQINTFSASANGASVLIDDITAYVPSVKNALQVTEAVSNNFDVGVMRCDIWREGNHLGWDYLLPYEDRQPLLGFYDDGNTALSDWELKYMAEHGINWQMGCWFLPTPYDGGPIKTPNNAFALENGYFYADNSSFVDFAIMWENSSATNITAEIFKNDIVPYWAEHYFKDDRYYTINNKPVISIYSPGAFLSGMRSGCNDDATAKTLAKECIEFIRQTCVELGFDGAYVLAKSTGLEDLALEKELGFDAIHAYSWTDVSGTADAQQAYLETALTNANNKGMGIIPVASVGLEETPWERPAGQMLSAGEFKKVLSHIAQNKDSYLKNSAKTTVLIDNWNEYGEGHFIMPTSYCGFDFLDAVRSVFVSDTAHEDTLPTESQKQALGTLYPSNRKPKPAAKISVSKGTTSIAKWTGRQIAYWSKNQQITNVSSNWGVYKGTSTGNDPAIYTLGLNYNLTDVNYIKVRIKRTGTDSRINLYYNRSSDNDFSEERKATAFANKNNTWEDVYFEVWKDANFNGTLAGLRLDVLSSKGTFEIESIELLTGAPTDKIKLSINDEIIQSSIPVQNYNGTLYAPMQLLADGFGANVTYLSDTNEVVFVTDTDVVRYKNDGSVYRNNNLIGKYSQLKGAEGTYLVPVEAAETIFYQKLSYNESTGTAYLTEDSYFPNVTYNIVNDLDANGKWKYRNLAPDAECTDITQFWDGEQNAAGISTTQYHSGGSSLYKDFGGAWQKIGFSAPLKPLTKYYFSAWMKNDTLTDENKIMSPTAKFTVVDENNVRVSDKGTENSLSNNQVALNTNWQYFEDNVSITSYRTSDVSYSINSSDTLEGNSYFYITPTKEKIDKVYFDDITLREIPDFRVFTKSISAGQDNTLSTGEALQFVFSHDIDKWSVTPEKILINSSPASDENVIVSVTTDEQTRETIVNIILKNVQEGKYTVSLANIKDAWGREIIGETSYSVNTNTKNIELGLKENDERITAIKNGTFDLNGSVKESAVANGDLKVFLAKRDKTGKILKVYDEKVSSSKKTFTFTGVSAQSTDEILIYLWNNQLIPIENVFKINNKGMLFE